MLHTYTNRVTLLDADKFGHMNNNQINNYFEQARVNFVEQMGLGYQAMIDQGLRFVISDAHTKYHSEIFPPEVFDIWTRLVQTRPVLFRIEQYMVAHNNRLVARQSTEHAFKKVQKGGVQSRLTRPPLEVIARLSEEPQGVARLL